MASFLIGKIIAIITDPITGSGIAFAITGLSTGTGVNNRPSEVRILS